MNILFTSVGRRVEMLRLFKRVSTGKIIGTDIDKLAPALQVVDKGYIVPPVWHPEYITRLIEICDKESVTMVFPLIDPDIPILAKNRFKFGKTHIATVPYNEARIAADKWLTFKFFKRIGVLTPRSWRGVRAGKYPLFIKPRNGSASKNIFKIHNKRELNFFRRYIDEPIIQEFIDGPEVTNDVICNSQGEVLSVISRQRIAVRQGEVNKAKTIYNDKIEKGCVKVARALKAEGPITVQCILCDKEPYFTEVNARLGGGAPFAVYAGADFPKWLLGAEPVGIPFKSYEAGLFMSRFDDCFVLSQEDINYA